MYEVVYSRKFKSSYKKLLRSGNFDSEEFETIGGLLETGNALPLKYRDHALKGNLQNKRECHISSNMLLVYEVYTDLKVIVLDDIGTHAKLFDR